MSSDLFAFKEFTVKQGKCAMKVGTDAVLLGAWVELPEKGNVLDIGTGTGIIAMMIAQRSSTFIDAIEIDEEAYNEAVENSLSSKWKDRISLYHISFQKFVPSVSKKYDAIISNPPFFSNCVQSPSESRTVARHTCNLSFEELAQGIESLLVPNGTFATILPCKESELFIPIAKRHSLYPYRTTFIKTTCSKPAKRVLLQFGFDRPERLLSGVETLIIENEDHSYSEAYKELTRSFYLGF